MLATPPRLPPALLVEEMPETPGPTKARINNLQNQVSELVRKNQALERKIVAEKITLQNQLNEKTSELNGVNSILHSTQKELDRSKKEVERCKSEGDWMRDELHLHSIVQQQKALLALAQEQMQVVELEQRLVQAERARIMRDHKLALFQAKEEDLTAELAEKDAQIVDLEIALSEANTSLAHQRAASSKTSREVASHSSISKDLIKAQSELSEAQTEISNLESKVQMLEAKVRGLKDREKEARSELDGWLREEKGKEGSTDKEKRELQSQLRRTKEELEETKDELEEVKRLGRDREKILKGKLRDAIDEKERLIGLEEELEVLKERGGKAASPKKIKERIRKTSPVVDDSDEQIAPKKKNKKTDSPMKSTKTKSKPATVTPDVTASDSDVPVAKTTKSTVKPRTKSPAKAKTPLEESDADNKAPAKKSTKGKSIPEDNEADNVVPSAAPGVEKKKKRKLLGVQSNFDWDPVMGSGDGVIPLYLSPAKPTGAKVGGTIPRMGFPNSTSTGRFNRFG
ncbi:hypothetical protein IAR55_002295 [Kwoniella newhampshirensis]|uniref:Uncharacterized protein n=1 Tax=Kwoniella newhampshirensis TaxID=1651941 RepID=A0AAW0YSC7_9TREE